MAGASFKNTAELVCVSVGTMSKVTAEVRSEGSNVSKWGHKNVVNSAQWPMTTMFMH